MIATEDHPCILCGKLTDKGPICTECDNINEPKRDLYREAEMWEIEDEETNGY
jgi:hypothetical protein